MQETFFCFRSFENNNKRDIVIISKVSASFITPVIQISSTSLDFDLQKLPGLALEPICHDVSLTNISSLPITALLDCPPPFELSPVAKIFLKPRESSTVVVKFSPLSISSKISFQESKQLVVSYVEHEQTDTVFLNLRVSFPNVDFSEPSVNFGCIPNHTKIVKSIRLENHGPLASVYSWALMEPCPRIIREVFDVLPIRGVLAPGASHVAQFSFYGIPDQKYSAVALCNVADGPTYVLGHYS